VPLAPWAPVQVSAVLPEQQVPLALTDPWLAPVSSLVRLLSLAGWWVLEPPVAGCSVTEQGLLR